MEVSSPASSASSDALPTPQLEPAHAEYRATMLGASSSHVHVPSSHFSNTNLQSLNDIDRQASASVPPPSTLATRTPPQHGVPRINVDSVVTPTRFPPPPSHRLSTDAEAGPSTSSRRSYILDAPNSAPPGIGGGTGARSAFGAGLNLRGLQLPTATIDRDDTYEDTVGDDDRLADLLPSPRRNAFRAALEHSPGGDYPSSPRWQSFESTSPHTASSSSRFSNDMIVPSPIYPSLSPNLDTRLNGSSESVQGKLFEPTPLHNLHARNLSLHFPQPGRRPSKESTTGRDLLNAPDEVPLTMIDESKRAFGGSGEWAFGSSGGGAGKQSKRRGHHHKHSLSHNFFSFLDPTVTNASLASASTSASASASHLAPSPFSQSPTPTRTLSTPTSVPIPLLSTKSLSSASALSPLPHSRLDTKSQLRYAFAIAELVLGAGLWVEGQLSGWRCLAGVGYLVVFDAAGVAVGMIQDGEGWRSIRKPYGSSRLVALLYFAQSLFLVFAAVYIAKESIETVLLGEGAHEHGGGGHGGHGHAADHNHKHDDYDADIIERAFPHLLLLLGTLASLFSAGFMGNHSKLVSSVGTIFLPRTYTKLPLVKSLASILGNPFCLTIAGGCAGILLGSLIVPPTSLHMLDSTLSLVLTLSTSALAYPSTRSFALILLQTAPLPEDETMASLKRTVKDLKMDHRILGVGLCRVWMIGSSSTSNALDDSGPSPYLGGEGHDRRESTNLMSEPPSPTSPMTPEFSMQSAPIPPSAYPTRLRPDSFKVPGKAGAGAGAGLVVSLVIHVDDGLAARDVLDITRMVHGRMRGVVGGGDVTVGIKRGWEGLEV